MTSDDFFRLVRCWLTVHLPRSRRLARTPSAPTKPR